MFLAPPPDGPVERGFLPAFSVVIPAYQAAATVAEAVGSALTQTLPAHEIIVCDDGSTDDIEGALGPFLGRITLVRKENGGAASALNHALAEATGTFVAVLDADDAYEPRRLEVIGAMAVQRPDLDILTTDAVIERDGEEIGLYSQTDPFEVEDQRTVILQRCFVGGWPAVRRSALLAIGGWDVAVRRSSDWDCWIRLIHNGARAGMSPEPLLRYRLSPTSLSADTMSRLRDRVDMLERNAATLTTLTERERAALEGTIRRTRRRVALAELEAAMHGGARRALLRSAFDTNLSARTRMRAALGCITPRRGAPDG